MEYRRNNHHQLGDFRPTEEAALRNVLTEEYVRQWINSLTPLQIMTLNLSYFVGMPDCKIAKHLAESEIDINNAAVSPERLKQIRRAIDNRLHFAREMTKELWGDQVAAGIYPKIFSKDKDNGLDG